LRSDVKISSARAHGNKLVVSTHANFDIFTTSGLRVKLRSHAMKSLWVIYQSWWSSLTKYMQTDPPYVGVVRQIQSIVAHTRV